MNQDEETRIIERIRAGERAAYVALVEEYKIPAFNLAYRMTGTSRDAEDLAQDIFLRIFDSLSRFDTSRKFYPWFYTIALNVIRNHLKAAARTRARMTVFQKEPRDTGADPERLLAREQELERMGECVAKLPVELREAVALRFYQDLAFRDVAEVLDVSLGAAKMRVYRGLEKLKQLLEDGG